MDATTAITSIFLQAPNGAVFFYQIIKTATGVYARPAIVLNLPGLVIGAKAPELKKPADARDENPIPRGDPEPLDKQPPAKAKDGDEERPKIGTPKVQRVSKFKRLR